MMEVRFAAGRLCVVLALLVSRTDCFAHGRWGQRPLTNSLTNSPSRARPHFALFDDSIDISPTRNGSICKQLVRSGDPSQGFPLIRDTVEIEWRIFDTDGKLISDSRIKPVPAEPSTSGKGFGAAADVAEAVEGEEEEGGEEGEDDLFSFTVGAEPREVILGWELAVRTMQVGEISVFTIQPELAFGEAGAPPLIAPKATLRCELSLAALLPSAGRKYKPVGMDESIRDELMDKIQSGESPIAPAATHTRATAASTETGTEARYFDPSQHKTDPRLRVSGASPGMGCKYSWDENANSLEIQLDLPISGRSVAKADLQVDIQAGFLSVRAAGRVVLEGPLHGKVDPSACMWAIMNPDQVRPDYRGAYLQLSLEKGYGSRAVWATVMDREFLAQQAQQKQQKQEGGQGQAQGQGQGQGGSGGQAPVDVDESNYLQ